MRKAKPKNGATPGNGGLLTFPMQQQEQTNWCWAAMASSVAHFYGGGSGKSQCEVANAEVRRDDCCGAGAGGACNVYGFMASSLKFVSHFGCWDTRVATMDQVTSEIDAQRPLCIRVAWSPGAHFMAIVGYVPTDGTTAVGSQCVTIEHSLLLGSIQMPYQKLVTGSLGGTWTDCFYTVP